VARRLVAASLIAASLACVAAERPERSRCAAIPDDRARLQCYDEAAADADEPLQELGRQPARVGPQSALSVRFELEPQTKQGVWNVRPHRPLFLLLARTTSEPNESPQSPSHLTSQTVPLRHTEAEFQLSFKVKAWQNMLSSKADLWVGYTQQSQWQVYSPEISRPFRETNYEPEVFALFPTDYQLLGLKGRFISVGVVHQSNGRSNPLSRSWNRVFAQFGFERGNFSLLVRPWHRIEEQPERDDNADIVDYLGRGDVLAVYLWGSHQLSLLARYNASTGHGALQGGWSFPIHENLKGYLKLFSGYGETMVDYNWKQTTFGFGVLLADWL